MPDYDFGSGAGLFYVNTDGLNAMELADGRRFEIRWIAEAPAGENYEVISELPARTEQL